MAATNIAKLHAGLNLGRLDHFTNQLAYWVPLPGRALLAGLFLWSGVGKVFNFEGTAGYMASVGMPLVTLFLVGAIILEVGGGLALLLGWRSRLAALALIVFTIPATLIFHNFWAVTGDGHMVQVIMFMKNLSIVGGLLMVVGLGGGGLSLDNSRRR